jgi:hypothetical protein
MYFVAMTKEIGGYVLPYYRSAKLSEEAVTSPDTMCVDVSDYPEQFPVDETGAYPETWKQNLYEGWKNYPKYHFLDGRLEPHDWSTNEGLAKIVRRNMIDRELKTKSIHAQTELKHLRKALKCIVGKLEASGIDCSDEAIQGFLSLSSFIEGNINALPKDEVIPSINLRQANGVEPQHKG